MRRVVFVGRFEKPLACRMTISVGNPSGHILSGLHPPPLSICELLVIWIASKSYEGSVIIPNHHAIIRRGDLYGLVRSGA